MTEDQFHEAQDELRVFAKSFFARYRPTQVELLRLVSTIFDLWTFRELSAERERRAARVSDRNQRQNARRRTAREAA